VRAGGGLGQPASTEAGGLRSRQFVDIDEGDSGGGDFSGDGGGVAAVRKFDGEGGVAAGLGRKGERADGGEGGFEGGGAALIVVGGDDVLRTERADLENGIGEREVGGERLVAGARERAHREIREP